MARFLYKSVSASGEVVEGELEAVSREAVIDRLRHKGVKHPSGAEYTTKDVYLPYWPLLTVEEAKLWEGANRSRVHLTDRRPHRC